MSISEIYDSAILKINEYYSTKFISTKSTILKTNQQTRVQMGASKAIETRKSICDIAKSIGAMSTINRDMIITPDSIPESANISELLKLFGICIVSGYCSVFKTVSFNNRVQVLNRLRNLTFSEDSTNIIQPKVVEDTQLVDFELPSVIGGSVEFVGTSVRFHKAIVEIGCRFKPTITIVSVFNGEYITKIDFIGTITITTNDGIITTIRTFRPPPITTTTTTIYITGGIIETNGDIITIKDGSGNFDTIYIGHTTTANTDPFIPFPPTNIRNLIELSFLINDNPTNKFNLTMVNDSSSRNIFTLITTNPQLQLDKSYLIVDGSVDRSYNDMLQRLYNNRYVCEISASDSWYLKIDRSNPGIILLYLLTPEINEYKIGIYMDLLNIQIGDRIINSEQSPGREPISVNISSVVSVFKKYETDLDGYTCMFSTKYDFNTETKSFNYHVAKYTACGFIDFVENSMVVTPSQNLYLVCSITHTDPNVYNKELKNITSYIFNCVDFVNRFDNCKTLRNIFVNLFKFNTQFITHLYAGLGMINVPNFGDDFVETLFIDSMDITKILEFYSGMIISDDVSGMIKPFLIFEYKLRDYYVGQITGYRLKFKENIDKLDSYNKSFWKDVNFNPTSEYDFDIQVFSVKLGMSRGLSVHRINLMCRDVEDCETETGTKTKDEIIREYVNNAFDCIIGFGQDTTGDIFTQSSKTTVYTRSVFTDIVNIYLALQNIIIHHCTAVTLTNATSYTKCIKNIDLIKNMCSKLTDIEMPDLTDPVSFNKLIFSDIYENVINSIVEIKLSLYEIKSHDQSREEAIEIENIYVVFDTLSSRWYDLYYQNCVLWQNAHYNLNINKPKIEQLEHQIELLRYYNSNYSNILQSVPNVWSYFSISSFHLTTNKNSFKNSYVINKLITNRLFSLGNFVVSGNGNRDVALLYTIAYNVCNNIDRIIGSFDITINNMFQTTNALANIYDDYEYTSNIELVHGIYLNKPASLMYSGTIKTSNFWYLVVNTQLNSLDKPNNDTLRLYVDNICSKFNTNSQHTIIDNFFHTYYTSLGPIGPTYIKSFEYCLLMYQYYTKTPKNNIIMVNEFSYTILCMLKSEVKNSRLIENNQDLIENNQDFINFRRFVQTLYTYSLDLTLPANIFDLYLVGSTMDSNCYNFCKIFDTVTSMRPGVQNIPFSRNDYFIKEITLMLEYALYNTLLPEIDLLLRQPSIQSEEQRITKHRKYYRELYALYHIFIIYMEKLIFEFSYDQEKLSAYYNNFMNSYDLFVNSAGCGAFIVEHPASVILNPGQTLTNNEAITDVVNDINAVVPLLNIQTKELFNIFKNSDLRDLFSNVEIRTYFLRPNQIYAKIIEIVGARQNTQAYANVGLSELTIDNIIGNYIPIVKLASQNENLALITTPYFELFYNYLRSNVTRTVATPLPGIIQV